MTTRKDYANRSKIGRWHDLATARRDYGPRGCAEDGAMLLAIVGAVVGIFAGAFQLGWRVTTAVLRGLEDRRDSAS